MKEVQELRPGDSGKEVFVSAGEADNLMRKDGTDNEDPIVVENAFVDLYGNIPRE